jgi:hypothetical protein
MNPSRDNTARLAKTLWTVEARDLSPGEFQARFDALYSTAEGPATLWQLGGAANEYLRCHPDTIVVPVEIVEALLASKMVDARIIGLKLLNRLAANVSAMVAAIHPALESSHEGELYGGLNELLLLLDRVEPSERNLAIVLLPALSRLASSRDSYVRETAARLSDWVSGSPTQ